MGFIPLSSTMQIPALLSLLLIPLALADSPSHRPVFTAFHHNPPPLLQHLPLYTTHLLHLPLHTTHLHLLLHTTSLPLHTKSLSLHTMPLSLHTMPQSLHTMPLSLHTMPLPPHTTHPSAVWRMKYSQLRCAPQL